MHKKKEEEKQPQKHKASRLLSPLYVFELSADPVICLTVNN